MNDPIPAGYVTLDEAVARLTADIPDVDVPRKYLQEGMDWWVAQFGGSEWTADELSKARRGQAHSTLLWTKRQLAIRKLREALIDGSLPALVRHPGSGDLYRLTPADWSRTTLARETIISGVIPPSVFDATERHQGRRVLLEKAVLDKWLTQRPRRATDANTCLSWLTAAMQVTPAKSPQTKSEWFAEAKANFGIISEREFDRLWLQAKRETGAAWGAGRPKLTR